MLVDIFVVFTIKMFKDKKSNHALQVRMDQRTAVNRFAIALTFIVFGLLGALITAFLYPKALFTIVELAMGRPVVNVNYLAFFLGGVLPMCFLSFMAAYAVICHKRVIILSELQPWAEKAVKCSVKYGLILSLCGGALLSALTIPLISGGDYFHCAEMTKGSGWDSHWVKDSGICSTRAR